MAATTSMAAMASQRTCRAARRGGAASCANEGLADAGVAVSKATVYNTLGLFARRGLLRERGVRKRLESLHHGGSDPRFHPRRRLRPGTGNRQQALNVRVVCAVAVLHLRCSKFLAHVLITLPKRGPSPGQQRLGSGHAGA